MRSMRNNIWLAAVCAITVLLSAPGSAGTPAETAPLGAHGPDKNQAGTGADSPVLGINAGRVCLMGAVGSSKPIHGSESLHLVVNGQRYRLFGLSGPVGEAAARVGPAQQTGSWCDAVSLVPTPPDAATVAIAGSANRMPRVPTVVTNPPAVYRQAVDALVPTTDKIENIELRQVLRIDLEGDGVEEALINAAYAPRGAAGAAAEAPYTMILLRKIVDGNVRNLDVIIHQSLNAAEDPDFEPVPPPALNIAGFVDTDGDGTLEILVQSTYWDSEWRSWDLYRVAGDQIIRDTLDCQC